MQSSTISADANSVREALGRWCDAMEAAAPELNELDGRLGDGDLGTTLSRCAANVREELAAPAESLEALLQACAKACARASGALADTAAAYVEGGVDPTPLVAATVGLDEVAEVLAGRRRPEWGAAPKVHVNPRG